MNAWFACHAGQDIRKSRQYQIVKAWHYFLWLDALGDTMLQCQSDGGILANPDQGPILGAPVAYNHASR